MYSYRSIQVVLQRNTIYRLTSIIFCCILPYSHLAEELAGKTNHSFWCPEDLLTPPEGRWKTLLHSTLVTYSQVIQTGWGFIKLHWEIRKIRRKHLNLFPPSPLTSMYKTTVALGTHSWTAATLSKGLERETRKALSITQHGSCLLNSRSLLSTLCIVRALMTSANMDQEQKGSSQSKEHLLHHTTSQPKHTCEPSPLGRVQSWLQT